MKRFGWTLALILGLGVAAHGAERAGGPVSGQAHAPCGTRCSIALADCEAACDRTDRDVEREMACVEGCYERYGPCLEGCRELEARKTSDLEALR